MSLAVKPSSRKWQSNSSLTKLFMASGYSFKIQRSVNRVEIFTQEPLRYLVIFNKMNLQQSWILTRKTKRWNLKKRLPAFHKFSRSSKSRRRWVCSPCSSGNVLRNTEFGVPIRNTSCGKIRSQPCTPRKQGYSSSSLSGCGTPLVLGGSLMIP